METHSSVPGARRRAVRLDQTQPQKRMQAVEAIPQRKRWHAAAQLQAYALGGPPASGYVALVRAIMNRRQMRSTRQPPNLDLKSK